MVGESTPAVWPPDGTTRPYVRWWWLNGPFREEDIEAQLRWFADEGFGGVELAWLHPGWWGPVRVDRPGWLSAEWSRLVAHAKSAATALDLGCDLTLGTVWPFGGTCVPREFAARTLDGWSHHTVQGSWEEPRSGPVLDHLSRAALEHYFGALGPASAPALEGPPSALFCDSLELDKARLWSPAF